MVRAIVLAAGTGKRLASMGWTKPKCLLPFGKQTLLDLLLDALRTVGDLEVVVVLGHQRELVEASLQQRSERCRFVLNPDFAHTNTIHSLWLARDFLDDDFLYFNADVLFDYRILGLLMAEPASALAIDVKACEEEEVKVIADENGWITRIGKKLAPADCLGEFIGIARFAPGVCPALIEALRTYNETRQGRQHFFESAVDDILERHKCRVVPIRDYRAVEIDTPEDYRHATDLWRSGKIKPAPEA
jgi:choline kinase